MSLENTRTQKNLMTAFFRESGAAIEYNFYANQAKKDGYEQIANTFNDFASNEKAHASVWFKLYHGISNTRDNLINSAQLENYERSVLYSEFAKTAREEGFEDIAFLFEEVAKIEHEHEKTYKKLVDCITKNCFYTSEKEITYKCLNCGNQIKAKDAPEKCPVCAHPQSYFIKQ